MFFQMTRQMSSAAAPPRHLVSMLGLTNGELLRLVDSTLAFKQQFLAGGAPRSELAGRTVALVFNKRLTRTRLSSEGAAVYFGGHPMFLGKDDIQLGVNELVLDTAKVMLLMTLCIFARVGPHQDILDLCEHLRVPIINALCDTFHPLQAITDIATIKETFGRTAGLKLAWIGDANNVINDLAIAALRLGISVAVATPAGIELDLRIVEGARDIGTKAQLTTTHDPLEAVKDADILVTDTWISMGQEEETAAKLQQFAGFQITHDMARAGGASPDWRFMHCLPRHKEEVDDAVFYSDRLVVFEEAEMRLYAAMAVLDGFVVKRGEF